MAIKKSDLYRSLWASCDELRGGAEVWPGVVLEHRQVSDDLEAG